jgi:hypothetical protein
MKYIFICLAVLMVITGCYKEDKYSGDSPGVDAVILKVWSARSDFYANGNDTTIIFVQLPNDAKDAASIVSFKASAGVFTETAKPEAQATATLSTVNGVTQRLAKITYQASSSPSIINIDVKVAGYQKTLSLELKPVPAESIKIIPSALSIKPDYFSEINIVTALGSSKGKVTPGQPVSLTVMDISTVPNTPKGSFRVRNDKSNDNGECNFVYTVAPDTSYRGMLMVRATAIVNSVILKDSIIIYSAK